MWSKYDQTSLVSHDLPDAVSVPVKALTSQLDGCEAFLQGHMQERYLL